MFGTLNENEIEEFIRNQFIGRIGCCLNNKIYVVPISYAYDGECVYCHTQEGLKISMMRENPAVCFEVDALETLATWKSAIAFGKYIEIVDVNERAKALQILLNRVYPFISTEKMHLGEHWPFAPDNL